MTKDEALKLALEALELSHPRFGIGTAIHIKAVAVIKEALAQPEQEPLEYWNAVEGWVKIDEVREHFDSIGCGTIYKTAGEGREPLYTTPPQRAWEPVETAPKDGTDVLLMYMHIDTQVVHNGFWIGASDADDESEIGWWSYDYSEVTRIKLDDWKTPTHWLPLPKLKEKNT